MRFRWAFCDEIKNSTCIDFTLFFKKFTFVIKDWISKILEMLMFVKKYQVNQCQMPIWTQLCSMSDVYWNVASFLLGIIEWEDDHEI